jgi:hypothetical protein
LLGFFRAARAGIELNGTRRPTVEIPDEWRVDYVLGRLVTAKVCSYADLLEWRYSWAQIWELHDFLDLQAWLDWQHHLEAEKNGNH